MMGRIFTSLLLALSLSSAAWAVGYDGSATHYLNFNGTAMPVASATPAPGQFLGNTSGVLTGQARPYDLLFPAATPTTNQTVWDVVLTRTINFPIDFTSSTFPDTTSQVYCPTNPSETDTYTIKCGSTTLGTIAITNACAITLATTSHAVQSCAAGSANHFQIIAPATVSGVVEFGLAGHTP